MPAILDLLAVLTVSDVSAIPSCTNMFF